MNVRALVAEVVGTFILVGVGSLSVVSAYAAGRGDLSVILLVAPFGFGLGLLAAIAIAGAASGGHFNPAVTLAALIDRRLDWVTAIGYAVAQVVGAVLASLLILVITQREFVAVTRNTRAVAELPAFATEVALTAIFVAVILSVTRRADSHALFAIPLTLTMVHFAGIPISGASVNPVRSLAPDIVAGDYTDLWIYVAAPLVGAIIGWAVYRFLTPPDDELAIEMMEDELEDDDFEDDELEDAGPIRA